MSIAESSPAKRKQIFDQPQFVPIFEDYKRFKKKRIGITGAKGVLGSILFERFIDHNIQIESFPGDITDVSSLRAWFNRNRFHYFFHFAAIVPLNTVAKDSVRAFETNAVGVFNVCKSIIESQHKCWLFLASTSHVYKPNNVRARAALKVGFQEYPESLYGSSKLAGEHLTRPILEHCNIAYCIGRIFSFSGINQQEPYLVPGLIRKIGELPEDGTLEVANAASVRDIMDAETVVDCILNLAKRRYHGTINIGSGKGMTVNQIAKHVAKMSSKKIQIKGFNENVPNSLVADVEDLKSVLLTDVAQNTFEIATKSQRH